ncbi:MULTISPECIES: hypothetical protein [unclassified Nonomuraea]|uniref:hypothetical protein n=1 Tax=unclassified Nonomuraea TaxID=2593643 RepID=UPI0033F4B0B0
MTRLREALNGIADDAPLVDLADLAIAGHRRRRRTTTALAALATAVVLGVTTVVVTLPGQGANQPATPQRPDTVQDLPAGRVGRLSHAYRTSCEVGAERHLDCGAVEWRVVTAAGTTYRVPQALALTTKEDTAPVAISRDGRLLAYYSRQAQAHVVRDLITGSEAISAATVKEDRIGMGSMLVVSDDGRHLAFDPREGSKQPGSLIDTRTGRTVPINGKYEPVAIKGGVAELVRYIKTDLWLMPVNGGGRPVRFEGVFIMFSETAPDGRTVVAFDRDGPPMRDDLVRNRLTVLDARTGRILRKVTMRGLPTGRGQAVGTGPWLNGHEVTVAYQDKRNMSTYGVDVGTGKARLLSRYPDRRENMILPGFAQVIP